MIEMRDIEGRAASVIYLDDAMEPVDKQAATLVKVVFRDNGETKWLVPPRDPDNEDEEEE